MLFNSTEFFLFFPIVFLLYWFLFSKNSRQQNILILVSSYVFYGWWDWRFLSLIALSSIVDYFVGLRIHNSKNKKSKKIFLSFSLLFNLSLLGFFKYFNFFIESWIDFLSIIGYQTHNPWTLKIILPVGISFYTFQTMSYSLDIYSGKLKPTKDFISFAAFVSFFPQLVAGPIERATNLLPQIISKRNFSYEQGVQGLRLILWGMFKKVVVADSLASHVDPIFNNYIHYSGGVLLLGLLYFSFQIYCDFSGYSDIAIGVAKLFGIEIMSNFKFPYFSRNIEEYWNRWHISLSSWFRDYIYIPLFDKIDDDDIIDKTLKYKKEGIKITLITFLVSGLWHGANWTFIMWGFIHSMLYLPLFIFGSSNYTTNSVWDGKIFPSISELIKIFMTFFCVMISWVFFRSDTIINGFDYLIRIFSSFSLPSIHRSGMVLIFILLIFEYSFKDDERNPINFENRFIRFLTYITFSYFIFAHFKLLNLSQFIYFQF